MKNNILKSLIKPRVMAFFAIVPLLTVTALIQKDCPVCNGSGLVDTMPEMDNVDLISMTAVQILLTSDACTMYVMTKFRMDMRLFNNGEKDAEGWLEMKLYEKNTDKLLCTQYSSVFVPGDSISDVTTVVAFGFPSFDIPEHVRVEVDVLKGDVDCMICSGSGRIALNMYPLINVYEDRLNYLIANEQQFEPPPVEDWRDILNIME
jgi:hypothetical protein